VAGRWHLEVMSDTSNDLVPDGMVGRLICTGMTNRDMPLIRYEVGDRGAVSPESGCECGRTLPILERIEGRVADNIVTADGRRIFWLNPVFYDLPIQEAQIIQETENDLRVRVVAGANYAEEHSQEIRERLRKRVGDMNIVVDLVDSIPRSANGKFRPVINKVV